MTPRDAWTLRLHDVAPRADWAWLRVLAAVLASRPGQELLLAIGDGLELSSREARDYGCEREVADLAALAELVREEAGLLPARVWPAHI